MIKRNHCIRKGHAGIFPNDVNYVPYLDTYIHSYIISIIEIFSFNHVLPPYKLQTSNVPMPLEYGKTLDYLLLPVLMQIVIQIYYTSFPPTYPMLSFMVYNIPDMCGTPHGV